MVKYYCDKCNEQITVENKVQATFAFPDGTKKVAHLCNKHYTEVYDFIKGKVHTTVDESGNNTVESAVVTDVLNQLSGNKRARLTSEVKDKVRKMYNDGVSRSEISKELGISYSSVYQCTK